VNVHASTPSAPASPAPRPRAPRSRAPLLVVLLALTLAVAAFLTWQAHQSSVSHRAVAQNVLRDYVEFASWEFRRIVNFEMSAAFEDGLVVSARVIPPGTTLESARTLTYDPALLDGTCKGCRRRINILTVFRIDPESGRLITRGAPLDPAIVQYLEEKYPEVRRALDTEPPCTLLVQPRDKGQASPLVIGYSMTLQAKEFYGYITDRASMAGLFERVMRERPLLPPTLTPGRQTNATLSARVRDRGGNVLYQSADISDAAHVSRGELDKQQGLLTYQVALRPDAAEALVIGGLPQSRLGLLLGLLALTAGLIVVALVQLRREYELARLRSDFVSNVSHELRTPLAQIRMFSETLLLGRVRSDAEARRSLEIIQQESRRLSHLVDNVLHVSTGRPRTTTLALEQLALAPLLREVVDAFAPLARARQVTVRFNAIDDVIARVDGSALRQIVLNLLDNAVKYGPAGQTVTVTLALDADDESIARITVDDEGPGIAAKDAAHIWAPFARLPQAAKAGVAGAGIGLAVVHELTQLHHGRASVAAAPSGGARFAVDLPGASRAVVADAWSVSA
jgi:signal transduction histidine kinase